MGPVQLGKVPALTGEGWQVLGAAQKVKTEGWRRRSLLRSRVCQQEWAERGWPRVTGGARLGWAYTCILCLGSVLVSVSLRRTTSHPWLQRCNVTLKMLLSWCPSYSLWDPQLNTHPVLHSVSFVSVCMAAVYGFCVGEFLVRGLCYWLLDQYELCKVFSTKVLIDLQTEALFAHPAGKLALLFGKLSLLLQKQRQS